MKGIQSRDMLKFYDMVVYVDDCDAMYVLLFHNLEFVIFTTIIHRVFLYSLITLSGIVYLDHNKLTNIILKISSNPLYDIMLVGISSNSENIGRAQAIPILMKSAPQAMVVWGGGAIVVRPRISKGWAGGQQMTLTVVFVF